MDNTLHMIQNDDHLSQGTLLASRDFVVIGRVKPLIFWSVMLVSSLLLAGLLFLASNGTLAVAAELPTPFTIKADTFDIKNSTTVLGISKAGHTIPVAITTDSATATNLSISKEVSLPFVGTVNFTLRAGQHQQVRLFGTRTDVQTLSGTTAHLTDDVTSIDDPNGVRLTAADESLTNVTIKAPYLSVDSGTFPGLSLSVSRS